MKPAGTVTCGKPGRGALLARARLGAVALEAAFVRVRPRVIGGIEHRVELLLIHQVDEELAERFAAGDESAASPRRAPRPPAPARARPRSRRALTGASLPDASRSWIVSTLSPGFAPRDRYAVQPSRSDPGAAPRAARVLRVVVGNRDVDDDRAGGLQLLDHALHVGGDLALAGEADEALAERADALAFQRRGVEAGGERSRRCAARPRR